MRTTVYDPSLADHSIAAQCSGAFLRGMLLLALLTWMGCADTEPGDDGTNTGSTSNTNTNNSTSNTTSNSTSNTTTDGGTTNGTTGDTSNTSTGNTSNTTTPNDVCTPNPCTNPEPPECDDNIVLTSADEGQCTDVGGEPVCDYAEMEVDCSDTGDICQRGACVPIGTGNEPLPGELVITEIMYNPSGVDDDFGEWIELYNKTETPFDLEGCVWRDNGDNSTPVERVIVPAESYVVFARDNDPATNGGVMDVVGTFDFSLSNDGDAAILECEGQVIDQVEYDSGGAFDEASGAALSLDPNRLNVDENNLGQFWCPAVDMYGTEGNLGTPGEANPICEDVPACEPNPCTEPPESVCDRNTAVSYVTEGSCRDINGVAECTYEELRDFCGGGQVCSEGACVEPSSPPAAEGDIIITEIMYNPSGLGFDDDDAEWIELYNTNSGDRDLSGCLFKDNNPSNDGAPLTDVVVPGGGYIIVGKSSDPQYFGGITPAATFSFALNNSNGGDAVILECGGEVFDRIDYDDGGAFPEGTGASLSLDPSARNNDDNGDGANWCLGAEDYAGGNLGSPGRANPSCPIGGDVCDPNPCTTPPVAICEGDTLVTYMAQGTCADAGGTADCTYPEDTRTDCTNGAQICFQGFNLDEPARCTDDPDQGMPPSLGEIEITEVMYNPAEISDNVGEWVELHNITFGDRNLSGCVLKDSSADEGSPLTGVVLGTGAYGIVGRSTDPTNFGGVTPLGTFNFNLNNDGDSVILECDGIEFDRLDYTNGGSFPAIDDGASLSASGGQWCAATSLYDDNGNLGTPRAVNPPCEGTGGACTVATTGSITAPGTYMGDNTDASNDFSRPEDACTDGDGVDEVWVLTVGSATSVCVDTLGTEMNGSGLDTILYVRTSCTDANTEVGCNDDIDFDQDIYDSRVGFNAQPGVQYFVIVEGYGSLDIGTYMLNVVFDACP